jgi:hypothetical protein
MISIMAAATSGTTPASMLTEIEIAADSMDVNLHGVQFIVNLTGKR